MIRKTPLWYRKPAIKMRAINSIRSYKDMYVIRISLMLNSGKTLIGYVQRQPDSKKIELTAKQDEATRFETRKEATDIAVLTIAEIEDESLVEGKAVLDFDLLRRSATRQ